MALTESRDLHASARHTPIDPIRRKLFLAIPLLALSASCAPQTVVYAPPRAPNVVYVAKAPPPIRVEHRLRKPVPRAIWIGGHWRWTGVKYIWVGGYWEHRPRGEIWIPGRWIDRRRGWVWRPGHWR